MKTHAWRKTGQFPGCRLPHPPIHVTLGRQPIGATVVRVHIARGARHTGHGAVLTLCEAPQQSEIGNLCLQRGGRASNLWGLRRKVIVDSKQKCSRRLGERRHHEKEWHHLKVAGDENVLRLHIAVNEGLREPMQIGKALC